MAATALDFYLPESLNASQPPERRGVRRDHVKMMVIDKAIGNIQHDFFYRLDNYLKKGDIVVLNNSRTVPAVLKATWVSDKQMLPVACEIRLAKKISDNEWEVLIPSYEEKVAIGDIFIFTETLKGAIVKERDGSPLKLMQFSKKGADLFHDIYILGEPIRYEYINENWKLDYYQTVFASQPGSVEMPSAGRAFSWELLFKLKQKGIKFAFIQLHTGLSYLLDDRWDHSPTKNSERYSVDLQAWEAIKRTKEYGGRIIAVGTTVVRTLETIEQTNKLEGWTNLYITKDFPLKVADGIITGFHEPKASHLELLSAFLTEEKLLQAYEEAKKEKYLWHEFGDMNLII
jgi:S-adenosylmethionine:tRNA ribosyltransferase-isomerase